MNSILRKKSLLYRVLTALLHYLIAIPILTVVDVLFLGFRIRGWDHLRNIADTGAVIACNHIHYLDCSFLGILCAPRRPVFCTLERNLQIPVVKYLIKWMGGVAIPQKISALRRFMEDAADTAQKGKLLIIYPEGELKLYCGHLRPFKDGAFKTAVRADVPVLPCYITQEKPRGIFRLFKQKPCLVLNVGEPVYPRRIMEPNEEQEVLDVHATVKNLRERVYCEMERLADRELPFFHGETELDNECPEVV